MPVYLRKNADDIDNVTISDVGVDDEKDDFLQDPDQRWDQLPQPFRFVNKIVTQIIEEAYDIANDREQDRITEETRIKPPKCECAFTSHTQGLESTGSINSTRDGKYVIHGISNGVFIMDAATENDVGRWEQDGVEILHIESCFYENEVYMICTIDDMGVARLFTFSPGGVILVQVMNEHKDNNKIHACRFTVSEKGGYFALSCENPKTKEIWLDVYKAPTREIWIKELESAFSKDLSLQAPPKPVSPVQAFVDTGNEETKSHISDTNKSNGTPAKLPEHKPVSIVSDPAKTFKFTQTTLHIKVKSPGPVQGVTYSSPYQLSKTIDNGGVFGSGEHHLMSQQQLDARWQVFYQNFADEHGIPVEHLPKDEPPLPPRYPTCHFLSPGLAVPFGIQTGKSDGEEAAVLMVWWSNYNIIHHYGLVKASKDLETKPDNVWLHPADIVASAVTPCTSIIAIANKSQIVSVYEKCHGIHRRTVYIESPIENLHFLDASICPQPETERPYIVRTSCYLLVSCIDGKLFLVNTGLNIDDPPSDVSTTSGKEERFTLVQPICDVPELLLTCRENGKMFIHNILTSAVICEMVLPHTYQLLNPWKPILTVAGKDIYFKGKAHSNSGSSCSGDVQTRLLLFKLNTFPILNKICVKKRPSIPYCIQHTIESRVNAFFSSRYSKRHERAEKRNNIWERLKNESNLVEKQKMEIKSTYPKADEFSSPQVLLT